MDNYKANNGKMAEGQLQSQLERMGLEPIQLEGWDTPSIISLLEEEAPYRVKGMLKAKPRGVLESCSPRYILDLGCKVDSLVYSTKTGYLGIDAMHYPQPNEGWEYFYKKKAEILSLHRSGVYEALGISRMGIALVAPTPRNDLDPRDGDKDEEIFNLLGEMEDSDFFASGIIDFRGTKDRVLVLPPD